MSFIADIQNQLVTLLQDAMDGSGDTSRPKKVDGYGGELRAPERVRSLPAVYVDVPARFDINAVDAAGSIFDGDYDPELILFCNNKASGADGVSELARLVDWTINAVKEKTLTIGGSPVELSRRIRGRLITDMEPASAVLTLELRTL